MTAEGLKEDRVSGCGLANYFRWPYNGSMQMLGADLPEVIALRSVLLPIRNRRCRLCAFDLGDPHWWQALGLPEGPGSEPLFIFCEGVLMHLLPELVESVIRRFGEAAPPGLLLAFDAACWAAVGMGYYGRRFGVRGGGYALGRRQSGSAGGSASPSASGGPLCADGGLRVWLGHRLTNYPGEGTTRNYRLSCCPGDDYG